jgi:hypothetical protein
MVKLFIFAIQLLIVSTLFAQAQTKNQPTVTHPVSDTVVVKTRLEELFKYVRSNDYEKAAPYLIYRGKDKVRAWKDVMHYEDPAEQKEIKRTCGLIKDFLDKAGKTYEYQLFQIDPSGPWYVWNLSYDMNGNRPSVAFAFIKFGSSFSLGDIDE